MNEYKITYNYPEGGVETAHITERTEAAARKLNEIGRIIGGLQKYFINGPQAKK